MIQRRTHTPGYWQETFTVDDSDLEYLHDLFLETETPQTLDQLARALVDRRLQLEAQGIERLLARGTLYQPRGHFEAGQEVVFPALGYAAGTVIEVRPGYNPEFGSFQVIQVEFEGGKRRREFAAAFEGSHRLNDEPAATPEADGQEEHLNVEEIEARYGEQIRTRLSAALERHPEFVRLADRWFAKDLLVDIHQGLLNLAEAVLDVNGGGPLPTEALLKELDLPAEINENLKIFSLNYALQQDDRFDEVGPAGEVLWYLRRLEPPGVLEPPRWLRIRPTPPIIVALDASLRRLERELDDEWSVDLPPPPSMDEVTFPIPYPHWRSGTLPLSSRVAQIVPTARVAPRVRFTLIDQQSGRRIPAWVERNYRYIYGLEDWYQSHDIPVGGYVKVRRGEEPGTALLSYAERRPKREWVRVVRVVDNRLVFEMEQRRSIACEFDELVIIGISDQAQLDEAWTRAEERNRPLLRLLYDLFPELAKLNPQSTVHAKTLYSAVNLIRRMSPAPIFAELVSRPAFIHVGDNYWRFDPDLIEG